MANSLMSAIRPAIKKPTMSSVVRPPVSAPPPPLEEADIEDMPDDSVEHSDIPDDIDDVPPTAIETSKTSDDADTVVLVEQPKPREKQAVPSMSINNMNVDELLNTLVKVTMENSETVLNIVKILREKFKSEKHANVDDLMKSIKIALEKGLK